jgi:hypothetical protein
MIAESVEEERFLFGGAAPKPPRFTAFGPEWTFPTNHGERGRLAPPPSIPAPGRRSGRISALPYPPPRRV